MQKRRAAAEPPSFDLALHRKQSTAFLTPATEVLYGGAAGGGKSHLMRVAALAWSVAIPGLQTYLFRRKLPDLVKNHVEGPKGFRALLAPWTASGHAALVEDEIRFWNGSKIYLCHCKDEKDRFNYQGAEIHALLIDELTHFPEVIYRFLRGRVRAVGLGTLSEEYAGRFPRILCGSNPGKINATRMDEEFDGMATALSTCIARDGQSTIAADLPMAGYKHTGVGNAAARTDYAAVGQVQDGAFVYVAGGGAADAYTLTLAPAIAAYAAGQMFRFVPANNNTGASTLAVNGLAAKDITKAVGTGVPAALDAGDLDDATVAVVLYDGTRFQLLNPQSSIPYIKGQKRQCFSFRIVNTAGTIQHRIGRSSDTDNAGNFADKINGASASLNNTPSVAAGVDFTAGAGIVAAGASIFLFDTADLTDSDDFIVSAQIVRNDTGTVLIPRPYFDAVRDVNGTTADRLAVQLQTHSGSAFNINTTNITAGKVVEVLVNVFLE